MNNFRNFNYFTPAVPNTAMNDFSYLNEMPNWNNQTINPKQNLNFNKCNFDGKTVPSNLYDVYSGYIRGNMYPDLYNQYKINKPYDINPLNKQAEMLTELNAYCFAAHDLNLYLDTHPKDREMINLYNEYRQKADKLTKKYEKEYGPLNTSGEMTSPWSWNDNPWPWENN